MQSCDNWLLGQILRDLNYEDLVLSNAVACNMRYFSYGGEELCVPEGRGYLDFSYVLDSLGIKYRPLDWEGLAVLGDFERVIVLLPQEFIGRVGPITRRGVTQVALVYSSFRVRRKGDQSLQLSLPGGLPTLEYELSLGELKGLWSIPTKPLGFSCQILALEEGAVFEEALFRRNLATHLKRFIEGRCSALDGTACVSGRDFYDAFLREVGRIFLNAKKGSAGNVQSHLFVSTLNAGSSCFYRREFADALLKKGIIDRRASCYPLLQRSQNSWGKITKLLRMYKTASRKEGLGYYKRIRDYISQLKEEEPAYACCLLERI